MKKYKLFVIILAVCCIVSCAVKNTYVPPHWRAQGAAAANIIMVVGFATRSPCGGDKAGFHSIFLHSERTHGSIQVDAGPGLKWDYVDHNGKYAIAHYAVRPGRYFLTNPFIFGSVQSIHAAKEVKLPFEVEAGKTYFLGAFSVYMLSGGKNIFGQIVPAGFIWLANKQQAPNVSAIKSKFPDLDLSNLIRLEEHFNMYPYIINDPRLLPPKCVPGDPIASVSP